MIVFCVTAGHAYTLTGFLEGRGRALLPRCRILTYDELGQRRRLERGTYVFADIERLSGAGAERAAQVRAVLEAAGPGIRLLNHPTRSMRRYELLRALHAAGVNSFDVHRLAGGDPPGRYPVFIRSESDHAGPLTPLLRSGPDLAAAAAALEARGLSREDKLVVEFCDTADSQGVVRKYGAFIVGGRVIPRHVLSGRDWCVKDPHPGGGDSQAEEAEFLRTNPHAGFVAEVARLARIDYGRIDYGLLHGRPQVWEINTNPCIVSAVWESRADRAETNAIFASRLLDALRELDGDGRAGPGPVAVPRAARAPGSETPRALANALLERLPLGARVRLRAALRPLLRHRAEAADSALDGRAAVR